MGDFEIIETGFSSADETINFGTRSIGLGSLYEISTIGCFKSYEDESGVPSVTINCLIENGQLVLATDKSLKIFDDTKLSNLLFTAAFDSSIVSIIVSPDNNFMLICLESGVVNVFHVKDRGEIFSVFTKCLPSTTEAPTIYIEGFFESQCSKVTTFIIVQGTGAIFRVFVSTKPFDQSENTFETRFEELLSLKTHITSASFSYPILLTNGAEFSVINTETQLVLSDNSHEVKTMFSLGRKILALDFQGNLFRICSLSMIIFPVEYDILLEDILVISDHKKSHIFAVTKPNETGETFLQLLDTG